MTQDFADFLDELGNYVDQRITHLPPALAEALSRPDTMLPMQELLHILDCPDAAGQYLKQAGTDIGTPAASA